MKNLIIALLLLSTTYVGRAQTSTNKAVAIGIVQLPSGKEIVTKNLIMPSTHIETIKMLPTSEIKKYSPDANIAMYVILKSYVSLLTLPEFYKVRDIEKKYRNRISVDGKALADTTNFLIYDAGVKSVVKKDDGIEITLKR